MSHRPRPFRLIRRGQEHRPRVLKDEHVLGHVALLSGRLQRLSTDARWRQRRCLTRRVRERCNERYVWGAPGPDVVRVEHSPGIS